MTAKKIILFVGILVVAANLALFTVVFMGTKATPPLAPPLPKPNGHDDFVKAGQMMTVKADAYAKMTVAQLRDIATTNAPALSLVRTGLARDCAVPLEDLRWKREEHAAQLNSYKSLALAFSAEAALAEVARRTNDAVEIWLDLLRFSHACCRGGAYIDAMVGRSDENFGLVNLLKMSPTLDARGCARVTKALQEIDAGSETLEQVKTQEQIYNGKLTFHQSFSHLIHFRRVRRYNEDFAAKFNAGAKERRQALLIFAARAYELDKGKRPASVAELIPAYIKDAPHDPTTGTNLEIKP